MLKGVYFRRFLPVKNPASAPFRQLVTQRLVPPRNVLTPQAYLFGCVLRFDPDQDIPGGELPGTCATCSAINYANMQVLVKSRLIQHVDSVTGVINMKQEKLRKAEVRPYPLPTVEQLQDRVYRSVEIYPSNFLTLQKATFLDGKPYTRTYYTNEEVLKIRDRLSEEERGYVEHKAEQKFAKVTSTAVWQNYPIRVCVEGLTDGVGWAITFPSAHEAADMLEYTLPRWSSYSAADPDYVWEPEDEAWLCIDHMEEYLERI
jgi:hypothetical protein